MKSTIGYLLLIVIPVSALAFTRVSRIRTNDRFVRHPGQRLGHTAPGPEEMTSYARQQIRSTRTPSGKRRPMHLPVDSATSWTTPLFDRFAQRLEERLVSNATPISSEDIGHTNPSTQQQVEAAQRSRPVLRPLSGTSIRLLRGAVRQAAGVSQIQGPMRPSPSQTTALARSPVQPFTDATPTPRPTPCIPQQTQKTPGEPANAIDITASPYNAVADNSTDDWKAIQQAIYNACQATPPQRPTNEFLRPVWIPSAGSTRFFAITQPLRMTCPYLTIMGDPNGSAIAPYGYGGPTIIDEAWGSNNLKYAPALVPNADGQEGQALDASGGTFVALTDSPAMTSLNGLHSFTVELLFSVSSYPTWINPVAFTASRPAHPGPSRQTTWLIGMTGSKPAVPFAQLHLSTGEVSLTGHTVITKNVVHHEALDFDGSTVRLFLDGQLQASFAAPAGATIVQGRFDTASVPDRMLQDWPDHNAWMSPIPAFYDSIRFSNVARYTHDFMPPTQKLANDANTILLLNFPRLCGPLETSDDQCSVDGTALALAGHDHIVYYLPVRGSNEGYAAAFTTISGLDLCRTWAGGGIFAIWAFRSNFTNLICEAGGPGSLAAYNLYDNDYETTVANTYEFGYSYFDDLDPSSTPIYINHKLGYEFGDQANDNLYENIIADSNMVGFLATGGAGVWIEPIGTERGSFVHPFVLEGTSAVMLRPFIDSELDNPSFKSDMYVSGSWAPIVVLNGELDSGAPAPAITFDGGQPIDLYDTSFGLNPKAHAAIRILQPPPRGKDIIVANYGLTHGVRLANWRYRHRVKHSRGVPPELPSWPQTCGSN